MKAYLGIAPCCGKIPAAMLDDKWTTAKDVADFAKSLVKSDLKLQHVDNYDPQTMKLERCHCKHGKGKESGT